MKIFLFSPCMVLVALCCTLSPASADVLYDTLYITDQHLYDAANVDGWSGGGVYGCVFFAEVGDDFSGGRGGLLTAATGDFLTFFGQRPADGVYVELYDDTGQGQPLDKAYGETTSQIFTAARFEDPIFGLEGLRLRTEAGLPYHPGTQWISIAPKDTSHQGDLYYIVRDLDAQIGNDAYTRARDNNCGYSITTWTSMQNMGFGAGPVAMKLEGVPIPEPALLALALVGLVPVLRRR